MLRVNGLFGWISENDRRSVKLFLGFVAALHLLALPTLFFILVILDPEHAPLFSWTGYATRYVPILTIAAVLLFAVLTWWNLNAVRRRLPFSYVWKATEPRLCRIAEPLLIAAGVPEPKLAVIESQALNAFAYGFGKSSATLVVTRGLIDGLDDDELAGVLAHEISHIKNGDVRFMAAANAFLSSLRLLDRANTVGVVTKENPGNKSLFKQYGVLAPVLVVPAYIMLWLKGEERTEAAIRSATIDVRDTVAWTLIVAFLPFLLLPLLLLLFMRQQALNLGALVRLLIASSREFIADASAVQLTQNPSALVSALQRIDGRSSIGDAPSDYHAMMIDGASDGDEATHPTVGERIAAIVGMTGSMAFNAPDRRDSRPASVRGFGRRIAPAVALETVARETPSSIKSWRRIVFGSRKNLLGLSGAHTVGMVLGLGALIGMNASAIARPAELVAKFNPMAAAGLVKAYRITLLCATGIGQRMGDNYCQLSGMTETMAPQLKEDSIVGEMARAMEAEKANMKAEGMYELPGGGYTSVPTDAAQAEITARERCFKGVHLPKSRPKTWALSEKFHDATIDVYFAATKSLAIEVNLSSEKDRHTKLLRYVDDRKTKTSLVYEVWGKPGWELARTAFATPDHQKALSALNAAMADPAFVNRLNVTQRAEAKLLLAQPDDFHPCAMTRAIAKGLHS